MRSDRTYRQHTGRGHRMPPHIQEAIVAAVACGATVAEAARAFGYSDRSVYRAARRRPAVHSALALAGARCKAW